MNAVRKRADWVLEGSVDGIAPPTRFGVGSLPMRIGRSQNQDVVLPVGHVSSTHAEIFESEGRLWLRDVGSSNGTWLNGNRVTEEAPLSSGDIVQFAGVEFVLERTGANARDDEPRYTSTGAMPGADEGVIQGVRSRGRLLEKLIAKRAVSPVFQPIVNFQDESDVAFELLGRGTLCDLPTAPGPLFEIAEAVGLAKALSALFRGAGLDAASGLPAGARLFINSHPQEVGDDALLSSLRMVRTHFPEIPLALEVHEGTVTDPHRMREMRAALRDIDIPIAFDDFGAGQARLLELTESPPDYLKFDMSLIRDIHRAPAPRQAMVEHLVSVVKSMGVYCLAEGIECGEELDVCRQMGFEYGQGYALGRPLPVGAWQPKTTEVRECGFEDTTVGVLRRRTPRPEAMTRPSHTRATR